MFNKEKFKPGYQNKPDSMRDYAEKMAKSCKAHYDAGGAVKKIRLDQSTADGQHQTNTSRKSNTGVYY